MGFRSLRWPRHSRGLRCRTTRNISHGPTTRSPESFTFVSYADVLAGRVSARTFTGKTVLVGATAIELHDLVSVPVHRSLPGVVVQALALQTLRMGALRAAPQGLYLSALLLWTVALVALFGAQSWRRNPLALAAAALLLVVLQLCAYAVYRVVIAVVPLALALAAAFTVATPPPPGPSPMPHPMARR